MKVKLFYTMLGVFVAWLGALGTFVWFVMSQIGLENVDPALTLLSGAAAGIITEFFLGMLTLSWQYWFRKQATNPDQ